MIEDDKEDRNVLLEAFNAEVNDLADMAADTLGLVLTPREDDDVKFVLAYLGAQIAGAETEYDAPYDTWIAVFDLSTLANAIRKVKVALESTAKPFSFDQSEDDKDRSVEVTSPPRQKPMPKVESGPLFG